MKFMNVKWWIAIIILTILLIGVGVQAYLISRERNSLDSQLSDLNNHINSLKAENDNLLGEIKYFSDPENLAKELKAKFNYRGGDEKMMIIIP
jgi:cell division protein FtsL